jgi:hypothetical protein
VGCFFFSLQISGSQHQVLPVQTPHLLTIRHISPFGQSNDFWVSFVPWNLSELQCPHAQTIQLNHKNVILLKQIYILEIPHTTKSDHTTVEYDFSYSPGHVSLPMCEVPCSFIHYNLNYNISCIIVVL